MAQTQNIKGALSMLEEILQQKKSAGVETVALSRASLEELEKLPLAFMRANSAAPVAAAPAPTTDRAVTPVAQPQPAAAPTRAVTPAPAQDPITQEVQQAAQTAAMPEAVAHPITADNLAAKVPQKSQIELIVPTGDTVRDRLVSLFKTAKQDQELRAIPTLRDQFVFATGNPEADLMFVGEAPGEEEETQKKPFVGPAGQKLDGIIKAMGLDRDKVYISNILKYRPKIGDGRFQNSKNRKPTPEEMAVSVKYVRSEIAVVQPKAIVALGGTAAEGLLEVGGSVSAMREQAYELEGIPVVVTYHPSYLCRLENNKDPQRTLQEKRKVWEDMLRAMELLGMPISDAQRGFFTK